MWRFFLARLRRLERGAMGARSETADQRKKSCSFIPLLLLILITTAGNISAQSVTSLKGLIIDAEDGTPLIGAVVDIQGTGYTAASDEYGFYGFDNLPTGEYTMKIMAPGYENAYQAGVKIVDGISRQVNIRLFRKVYYLGKITVQGSRGRLTADNVEILQKDEIIRSRARDIPELLETVPGVYIQETGSGSGRSQVKIRGSAPEHVLVLVDGHRINSSGNGVADLSSIPIEMVERLEIHKGGASAEFGPDALGGVLNIITQKTKLGDKLSIEGERGWGSWKNELYHFDISDLMISSKFSGNFAYSLRQSVGDFDFNYQVEPDPVIYSGTRINNHNESANYFGSGIYQIDEKLKFTYSGQYYKSESGLPGGAKAQNEAAYSEDNRRMFNSSLSYELSPDRDFKLDIGLSRFEQHFADDQ
ncbi:MAG: TonB-dependent receptor, partial [Candidatus Zixiibacteriota bacterium]